MAVHISAFRCDDSADTAAIAVSGIIGIFKINLLLWSKAVGTHQINRLTADQLSALTGATAGEQLHQLGIVIYC